MKQDHTEERVLRLADLIGEAKDEYIEAASPEHIRKAARFAGTAPSRVLSGHVHAAITAAACILLMMTSALILPRLLGKPEAAADTAVKTEADHFSNNSDGTYTTQAAEAWQFQVTGQPELPCEEEAAEAEAAATTWDEAPAVSPDNTPKDQPEKNTLSNADASGAEPSMLSRSYHDTELLAEESFLLWSWEDMPDHERYSLFILDGELYNAVSVPINGYYRDVVLGTGTAIGHDGADNYREYKKEMYACSIRGIADNRVIAVYMEEEDCDYIFRKAVIEPPATLGALIEAYAIDEPLTTVFWRADSETYYAVSRDMQQSLWDTLSAYADAPYTEDAYDREADSITFYASYAICGFENRPFIITADGYLHTNAFDPTNSMYSYHIGAENAQALQTYLRENCPRTEIPSGIDPDMIIGTVTAITDHGDGTYTLTIDDTAACRDPAEGLLFTVPLTRITETRYIKNNKIRIGDTIALTYANAIPRDTREIDSVTEIRKARITENRILISE